MEAKNSGVGQFKQDWPTSDEDDSGSEEQISDGEEAMEDYQEAMKNPASSSMNQQLFHPFYIPTEFHPPCKYSPRQYQNPASYNSQLFNSSLGAASMQDSEDSFFGYETVVDGPDFDAAAIGHTEEANLDHFTETFQELGAKLVDRSHDSNLAEEMRDSVHSLLESLQGDVVRVINSGQLSSEMMAAAIRATFTRYQSIFHPSNFQLPAGGALNRDNQLEAIKDAYMSDSGISNASSTISDVSIKPMRVQLRSASKKSSGEKAAVHGHRVDDLAERLKHKKSQPSRVLPHGRSKHASVTREIAFEDLNGLDIIKRSKDGAMILMHMKQSQNKEHYDFEIDNTEVGSDSSGEGRRKKQNRWKCEFVRILGYHLMDVEKKTGRLITAQERREFMSKILKSLPVKLQLEQFTNSMSKGMLDMFVRNKRHYQTRKYGIGIASQPTVGKRK